MALPCIAFVLLLFEASVIGVGGADLPNKSIS
jgi:hypothetical protein